MADHPLDCQDQTCACHAVQKVRRVPSPKACSVEAPNE